MNSVTNGGQLLGNCVYCGYQIYSGMAHFCPTNLSGTQMPTMPSAAHQITPEVLKRAVETFGKDYFGMAQMLSAVAEGQQSSTLVAKTPSASPGERE